MKDQEDPRIEFLDNEILEFARFHYIEESRRANSLYLTIGLFLLGVGMIANMSGTMLIGIFTSDVMIETIAKLLVGLVTIAANFVIVQQFVKLFWNLLPQRYSKVVDAAEGLGSARDLMAVLCQMDKSELPESSTSTSKSFLARMLAKETLHSRDVNNQTVKALTQIGRAGVVLLATLVINFLIRYSYY